jgi:hypothetical protein
MEEKKVLTQAEKDRLIRRLINRFEMATDEEKAKLFNQLLEHIEPMFLIALNFAFSMTDE